MDNPLDVTRNPEIVVNNILLKFIVVEKQVIFKKWYEWISDISSKVSIVNSK